MNWYNFIATIFHDISKIQKNLPLKKKNIRA